MPINKLRIYVVVFILLIVILVFVSAIYYRLIKENGQLKSNLIEARQQVVELESKVGNIQIEPDKTYAVFLKNGEYYFTKITVSGDYFVLSDIYYFKNHPDLKSFNLTAGADRAELVKIENNSFGDTLLRANLSQAQSPESIVIAQDKIFYYEPLTIGSRVEQAIKLFEEGH